MKRKWKVLTMVLVAAVLLVAVLVTVRYNRRGIVTVQTGRVMRQDLVSLVTASGEIKPNNYINIGANSMGRITDILVKEGDAVRKSQVVAKLESIQAEADVQATQASVSSSEADAAAAEAGLKAGDENLRTLEASIDRAKAETERASLSYSRAQQLFDQKLIAKQDFDQRKSEFDSMQAGVREAEARLAQAQAQRAQMSSQFLAAQKRVMQARANLLRSSDVLQKHSAISPIEGVVTNLPVRVGETVVPGVQNSSASLIMTIADMSLITAEVMVDETDIVNVTMGQVADIVIDAIPDSTFKGHVIEIGNTAILRSTGLAASQSAVSSQEAKDFKVVVALDNPPPEIRPGLSCTAKITAATRDSALAIPIQALTIRQRGDLEEAASQSDAQAAGQLDPAAEKARKEELQGVFVVAAGEAVFREVETGITGATEIEVLNGLKEGEEIVTGSYQVIRTLRNEARVKVDNRTAAASR